MAPDITSAFASWQAGTSPRVEYSLAVLEEVRSRAVGGARAFGHGGLEVGGVLYGVRERGGVRIVDFAEAACEHSLGPGFVLSEKDRVAFGRLLESREGIEPVGWYCSHTRTGLSVSPNDREVFDRFFQQPGAIALVLQPSRLGPATATFLYRDNAGEIREGGPGSEFIVEPTRRRMPQSAAGEPKRPRLAGIQPEIESASPTPADAPRMNKHSHVPPPAEELPAERPTQEPRPIPAWALEPSPPSPGSPADEPFVKPRRSSRKWMWAAAALAAAACIAAMAVAAWRGSQRLGLQAHGLSGGEVRIEWNRDSAAVRDAVSGMLEIRDGGSEFSFPLDSAQLRSSSVTYARRSDHIAVRLRIQPREVGAQKMEESVVLVAPGSSGSGLPITEAGNSSPQESASPPATPPAVSEPAGHPDQQVSGPAHPDHSPGQGDIAARSEPRSADREAEGAPVIGRKPSEAVAIRSAASPGQVDMSRGLAAADRTEEPAPAPAPRRIAVIPAAPSRAAASPAALPTPPEASAHAARPHLPFTTPVGTAPAPPRPEPRATPRSGRIIWTGLLGRRGTIQIDGSHANVGSLAGALPGVPVSMRILPAEFSSQGLVAYTSDAAANGRSEPPGSANGWNQTAFEWDPDRVRQIAVVEAPVAANQFKRLTLRNDGKSCSMIIIEWSAK